MTIFVFKFVKTIEIEVDDSLSYLVDDEEFQNAFWHVDSFEQIARHIAWNRDVMGWDYVEGLKPEEQNKFKILSSDWDDI